MSLPYTVVSHNQPICVLATLNAPSTRQLTVWCAYLRQSWNLELVHGPWRLLSALRCAALAVTRDTTLPFVLATFCRDLLRRVSLVELSQ